VPWYAQGGWLEPLDKWITAAELADFIPGLLLDLKYEGQTYALPYNRSTQGIFYNKDLMREAGLDPEDAPETWDEFREAACAISELGDDIYGAYAWQSRWFWGPFIYAWGGQINDAECNVAWNSPEAVAAFTFMQNLKKDGCAGVPANLTGGFTQSNAEFVQGTVGFVWTSTALNSWIGDVVDFDYGFMMMPSGPAARAVTHGAANLSIHSNKSEAEKAAAWEFVQFLTSPEATAEFHMATGYMATRYSALELPEVKAFHTENPYYRISIDQLEYAFPTSCIEFSVPEYQEVVQGMAIPDIYINERDVATVLAESAAEVQAYVDEYRAAGTLIIR
jgi:sn-glycerol 3-phosphate transport system substrate-binding protein